MAHAPLDENTLDWHLLAPATTLPVVMLAHATEHRNMDSMREMAGPGQVRLLAFASEHALPDLPSGSVVAWFAPFVDVATVEEARQTMPEAWEAQLLAGPSGNGLTEQLKDWLPQGRAELARAWVQSPPRQPSGTAYAGDDGPMGSTSRMGPVYLVSPFEQVLEDYVASRSKGLPGLMRADVRMVDMGRHVYTAEIHRKWLVCTEYDLTDGSLVDVGRAAILVPQPFLWTDDNNLYYVWWRWTKECYWNPQFPRKWLNEGFALYFPPKLLEATVQQMPRSLHMHVEYAFLKKAEKFRPYNGGSTSRWPKDRLCPWDIARGLQDAGIPVQMCMSHQQALPPGGWQLEQVVREKSVQQLLTDMPSCFGITGDDDCQRQAAAQAIEERAYLAARGENWALRNQAESDPLSAELYCRKLVELLRGESKSRTLPVVVA